MYIRAYSIPRRPTLAGRLRRVGAKTKALTLGRVGAFFYAVFYLAGECEVRSSIPDRKFLAGQVASLFFVASRRSLRA